MIAIDTSAILSIALAEPEEATFSELLVKTRASVATPVLVEASLVLARKMPTFADQFLSRFVSSNAVTPVDYTWEMFEAAAAAFRQFGKGGGHPAQLNFGDCMSYAAAKVLNLPLLFKGEDFARTDIRAAHLA